MSETETLFVPLFHYGISGVLCTTVSLAMKRKKEFPKPGKCLEVFRWKCYCKHTEQSHY